MVNLCADPQDPQYMQQALTNALLMDAVVGSLQSSKAIYAASKLAHFDRIKTEGRTDLRTDSSCFQPQLCEEETKIKKTPTQFASLVLTLFTQLQLSLNLGVMNLNLNRQSAGNSSVCLFVCDSL